MSQICVPVLVLIVLCTVGLNSSEAASRRGCCTMYTSATVPINAIRGFSIQTSEGRCKLDAVIFHTVNRKHICTDPSLPWVSNAVDTLKEQFKKIKKQHKKQ